MNIAAIDDEAHVAINRIDGPDDVGVEPASDSLMQRSNGGPQASLNTARAHWLTRNVIAWNVPGASAERYALVYAPTGGLKVTPQGIEHGQMLPLDVGGYAAFEKFPHLYGFPSLRVPDDYLTQVPEILRGQVAITAYDSTGMLLDATGLQLAGVLDDLYSYAGDLGVTFAGATPTLRVWAPTARSVTLHLFDDADPTTAASAHPLTLDAATGVWSIVGHADWRFKYYLYAVEVYVPATGRIERNLVTDPYSLSLSTNSTRSQIVDLGDVALKPAGWDQLVKPDLVAPTDIVIYELHVRDFSINDQAVPEHLRGTFAAFTWRDSAGMQHLRDLADAGLTHIHLLPTFDIATIEEDRTRRTEPDAHLLALFAPDSDQQQALIAPTRDRDGFNWGYDPYHYTVPEGSYATDPNGTPRLREFREMVQALNTIGLRVIMDVVYNHTHAAGQKAQSVLDRVVPGYYYRLDADGVVTVSTCCPNTASEHAMMEKLILDSLRVWATAYKVDGFRFDLMGHHMLRTMLAVREMLDGLTLERDGVDGKRIYIYGEGWNFGEVADNARGINATQLNIGGTGIGVFNDRLRDAVRGGAAFADPRLQGWATGLFSMPNAAEYRSAAEQYAALLIYTDQIRAGLAGNLRYYPLVTADGHITLAANIPYVGKPTGYTHDPRENVVYVSAHDNETLFDAIQLKASNATPLADRVRMHGLALSVVAFAQGVPFFHAGDDLLRSKSLDRNSYNSGDWFNRIDWTGQTTTWGAGLPPDWDNRASWPIVQPLLADPALVPTSADIAAASAAFQEMLRIRRSSPLFRLRTAADIKQRVHFLNTGPDQIPGLIVMLLDDTTGADLDPAVDCIVVLFNATPLPQTFAPDIQPAMIYQLHPIQQRSSDATVRQASFDAATGNFAVPAYTTAVFVAVQSKREAKD